MLPSGASSMTRYASSSSRAWQKKRTTLGAWLTLASSFTSVATSRRGQRSTATGMLCHTPRKAVLNDPRPSCWPRRISAIGTVLFCSAAASAWRCRNSSMA